MGTADKFIVAVDIGGTQARAALVEPAGHIVARQATPTQAEAGVQVALRRIMAAVWAVLGDVPKEHILGLGVAAPGPLDPWRGVIYNPPNLPGWDGLPLRELWEREFGLPVYVGNDANLAALGEHRYGAGRGIRHLVYLTISTGIGSGVIVDGDLLLGAAGLASEAGHMTVEANGPRCKCGNIGCLEALAAGPAIARAGAAALRQGRSPGIGALAKNDPASVTGKVVVEAALAGDAVAKEILQRAAFYIGVGVVNLIHLFNPNLVILGGGIALGAGEALLAPIREVVSQRAMPAFCRDLRITLAALGDDAGLLGAAALVLSRERYL